MANITHGGAVRENGRTQTRVYIVWKNMHARCRNENAPSWKDYGGRGITVCAEWASFEAFYTDMGNAPRGLMLDRIDNNKGYYKDNCRWATRSEQNQNRSGWGKPKRELGVGWDTKNGCWRVRVKRGGFTYFLGNFTDKEEAIEVREAFFYEG